MTIRARLTIWYATILLLSLAAMHFANLYVFHRIRRRATIHTMPAPLAPHGYVHLQTA